MRIAAGGRREHRCNATDEYKDFFHIFFRIVSRCGGRVAFLGEHDFDVAISYKIGAFFLDVLHVGCVFEAVQGVGDGFVAHFSDDVDGFQLAFSDEMGQMAFDGRDGEVAGHGDVSGGLPFIEHAARHEFRVFALGFWGRGFLVPPSRRVDLRKHFAEGVEEGDLPQFQVVADLEPALEDRVEQVVLGEVGHAEVVEGGL